MNNKWGFIDKHGQLVILCIYDDVSGFYYPNDLAKVRRHGYKGEILGFINKQGVEYWED